MDINRNAPVTASAEAFVDARPTIMWSVQTELSAWPNWNPDVASVDFHGPLAPGTEFRWKTGGVPITSTLREVQPERRIGWTGRAPLGIRAEHVWSFEPERTGTLVRTEESFGGLLVRVFAGPMRRMLTESLENGLATLKAEAERRAPDGIS